MVWKKVAEDVGSPLMHAVNYFLADVGFVALKQYLAPELRKEAKLKALRELHGQTAFPGKVVGTVKVIRGMDDVRNFANGIILVASSTAPMHVPAMEKALAIVTDEGGLLSHAAFVSREFKKPCVVGTKHATKILKDGDLVEVNAGKGVVKILKRG